MIDPWFFAGCALGSIASPPAAERITYQPRYVAYARHNGFTPATQLSIDTLSYPGGCMAGFTIWLGKQWSAWEKLTGRGPNHTEQDHVDFDAWLQQQGQEQPCAQ